MYYISELRKWNLNCTGRWIPILNISLNIESALLCIQLTSYSIGMYATRSASLVLYRYFGYISIDKKSKENLTFLYILYISITLSWKTNLCTDCALSCKHAFFRFLFISLFIYVRCMMWNQLFSYFLQRIYVPFSTIPYILYFTVLYTKHINILREMAKQCIRFATGQNISRIS